MSRFFNAVRFGGFVFGLLLLMSCLSLPAFAQAQNAKLSATVKVATKQVQVAVAVTPFTPVEASGGTAPYTFSMVMPLPAGLVISDGGEISGTPTAVTAAADYKIRVTDANGDAVEQSVRLEVIKREIPLNFSVAPNPAFAGANVVLKADFGGSALPTGKIVFRLAGFATPLGEATIINGEATLNVTTLPGGTSKITAVYEGDANVAAAQRTTQVTITLSPVTAALSVDQTAILAGQAVTLTVTMTPRTATGSVVFKDGATDLTTVNLVNGVATYSATLTAGRHSLTAEYQGSAVNAPTTSNDVTVDVTAANLTTNDLELTVDKTQASVGQLVTFTATIKVNNARATTAAGTVRFFENNREIAVVQVNAGAAILVKNDLTQGSHAISATFSGDLIFAASRSSTVTVDVVADGKVPTQTQLTANKQQLAPAEILTLNASVTPETAMGTFYIYDEANGQGAVVNSQRAAINGKATIQINNLARGTHRIYATFVPQGNFTTSTSAAITVTVGDTAVIPTVTGTTASTVTIQPSKTQAAYAELINFTITVNPNVATGSVTLRADGRNRVTANLVNGSAVLSLSDLEPGDHAMSAVYSGSNVYATSTSRDVTVTIDKIVPRVQVMSTPRAPAAGQTFELKAVITPSSATGTVTFNENGAKVGEATVTGGVATIRIANATLGDHVYSAAYSGDGRVKAGTSTDTTISVVAVKPSPLNDPTVRAMLSSQVSTATRMAHSHMGALQLRLETLHEEDVPAFSNGITFSQAGNLPSGARAYEDDPWVRGSSATPASRSIDAVLRNDRFTPVSDKMEELTLPKLTRPERFHVWTAGAVMFGGTSYTGLGASSRTSFSLAGLTAGVDAKIADGIRAGFAASYSAESSELGGGGGDMKTNMIAGSLYASWRLNRNIFVDALVGYGFARFNSQRMDSNLLMKMPGNRTGNLLMASLGVSYDEKSGRLKYAPYARLDTVSINLGAYSEEGDPSWSITYQAMHSTAQSLVLGLRAEQDYDYKWGVLSPFGRLEYRHALTVAGVQTVAYAGDPAGTYTLSPASSGGDSLTGTLGVKAIDRKRLAGSVEYSLSGGQGGIVGQGLRGAMRLGF